MFFPLNPFLNKNVPMLLVIPIVPSIMQHKQKDLGQIFLGQDPFLADSIQEINTCSKSTIKTLEKGVKYV